MIHAYASIWRCFMHDVITEIREKHVRTFVTLKLAHNSGNGNNCQPLYREYMKGEEGVLRALAPPPPRSQRNEKKSNKMEASPFL